MLVLITGATGFIGSAVARKHMDRGDRLRLLVRDPTRLDAVGLAANDQIEVVTGSITDPDAVKQAVAGVDLVQSIAGTFREPNLSDEQYRQINVDAPRQIVEAAADAGVPRVVHCSTCGIHGDIPRGQRAAEDFPIRPVGIYEETKAAGERAALDAGKDRGVTVTAIRPTPVYGPGDTRLLKLYKLVNKDTAVILGDGKAGYHLAYIDDLADAFVLAGTIEPERVAGESFLIGNAEIPSLNDMITTLASILGKTDQKVLRLPAGPFYAAGTLCEAICRPLNIPPPIYRRRVTFFTNNRAFDIAKAREKLAYDPKTSMQEGLATTADWYREQGLL
jgi:nucleoside-diphosphate-sugar epimerase